MRSNKEIVYQVFKEYNKSFNTADISQLLDMQRSNVSSILNELVDDGKLTKSNGRPVVYDIVKDSSASHHLTAFDGLIGVDGSLKNAVQLAKASIFYPSQSLKTLIRGQQGSGKSYFSQLMHQLAIEAKQLPVDAPYIKFNCHYYVDDPQYMMDSLFGSKDSDDEGYLARANGGVLFIDNVDALSTEAFNHLMHFIDVDQYYDSKTDSQRQLDVFLICSTSSSHSEIVETLARKIPINIELPDLEKRPLTERFELIQRFFAIEAARLERIIEVNSELVKSLMSYTIPGSVKQLRKDIQLGCAKAYARAYVDIENTLVLDLVDMPDYIRISMINYQRNQVAYDEIVAGDYSLLISKDRINVSKIVEEDIRVNNIYETIIRRSNELSNRGINDDEIDHLISVEIENIFSVYHKNLTSEIVNKEQLSKLVDNNIIILVEEFLQTAGVVFGKKYPASVFYGLSLHLNMIKSRGSEQRVIGPRQILDIVDNYHAEYAFVVKYQHQIESVIGMELAIDELVLLTMFLTNYQMTRIDYNKPKVLIVMHGKSGATSVADAINDLVKLDNVYGYDLDLDISVEQSYQELKTYIQSIDNGKGIIVIYDMGSIKMMCSMITQETSIDIRLVQIPLTLIGLEFARKASMEDDMDVLYHSIINSNSYNMKQYVEVTDAKKKKAIITLCNTGEGAAIQIMDHLNNNIESDQYVVIPVGNLNRDRLTREMKNIALTYKIHAVVGAVNPLIGGYPFISIVDALNSDREQLAKLLSFEQIAVENDNNLIFKYLGDNLKELDINKAQKLLPKIVDQLQSEYLISEDEKLGLMMHIAVNINRNLSKETALINPDREHIMEKHPRQFKNVLHLLQPIERNFDIIFSDDDISVVTQMLMRE